MSCLPGGHYRDYYPDALSFMSSHCNSFEDQLPVDFSDLIREGSNRLIMKLAGVMPYSIWIDENYPNPHFHGHPSVHDAKYANSKLLYIERLYLRLRYSR